MRPDQQPEPAPKDPATWPETRVLVVDPNPDRLRMMGLRLRAEGYRVLGAMDGVMATHVATTQRPDVIVLDTSIAGNRGHLLAKRLRAHVGTMAIPIIPVTPSPGGDDGPSDLLTLVQQASERARR